ncbi:MAG: hypothetical protein A2339_03655 [Elusimicrobia bacterium RIFOXYB12_FULL_50_12]|nr:MAG: hypothetical protein A2339_03655 [Elusimicrobia bacterium RIFOXYB12_FULL_50_12]
MKKLLPVIPAFFITAVFFTGAFALEGASKVKLDNGLTAILIEDHSQPLVSVQVWVKAGSINENTKTYGLSHFLEHLIFKGSKNYPGDEMTRKTETNGGSINAATSKEYTQYHIDI